MVSRRSWTRSEQLIVLRLYFTTDFGKLHQFNPEIIEVAGKVGLLNSMISLTLLLRVQTSEKGMANVAGKFRQ